MSKLGYLRIRYWYNVSEFYLFLQQVKEFCSMHAIHLCVVELEWYSQSCFKQVFLVFTPNYERIVENAAKHSHCSIYVILSKGRGTDNHALGQIVISAIFRNPTGES